MKVTTQSGKVIPIGRARKIQGEYFLIGDTKVENSGECYLIGDRYFRDTPYIVYDHLAQEYVINNSTIFKGIIGIKNGELIPGNFSIINGINNNLYVFTETNRYPLLNDSVLSESLKFRRRVSDGNYYQISILRSSKFSEILRIDGSSKSGLNYDSHNDIDEAVRVYNELPEEEASQKIKTFGKLLGDYSFGVEFETSKGQLTSRDCHKNGLIPLRDGSISGFEYATIPLKGVRGLQSLENAIDLFSENTEYDKNCSLHMHIGGIPRTEEFCVAMFKTMFLLQDDFFELFPPYKKYNYGYKSKLYTAPLPQNVMVDLDRVITSKNVTENFARIFQYLSMGESYSRYENSLENVHSHPRDLENNRKWQIRTRYHFFNLIPLIFTNKQTVEFRIHTPTFDKAKVMHFLFMNVAIVDFVKKYQDQILANPESFLSRFDLKSVIHTSFRRKNSDLTVSILNYIDSRRRFMYRKNSEGKIFSEENEFKYICNIWRVSRRNIRSIKRNEELDEVRIPTRRVARPSQNERAEAIESLRQAISNRNEGIRVDGWRGQPVLEVQPGDLRIHTREYVSRDIEVTPDTNLTGVNFHNSSVSNE